MNEFVDTNASTISEDKFIHSLFFVGPYLTGLHAINSGTIVPLGWRAVFYVDPGLLCIVAFLLVAAGKVVIGEAHAPDVFDELLVNSRSR